MRSNPFLLLCGTGFFAIFSSTISKSPVLPLFASHLGANPAGVGMVAAVSAFTGIIASIPAGILSDKLGRRKLLVFSALIFATAPFLYLLVTDIWQLAIIRFYHGFATALFIPVAMALVSDMFHKERGAKMGWFSTSTLIGRFIAPVAGGSIIGAMAFNPAMGFKLVYLVCGAAGVVVLVLAFKIPSEDGGSGPPKSMAETVKLFKSVISNKGIVVTASVEAAILFAYGTFETFMPLYAVKNGLSVYKVGVLLSVQVITLAFTKPVMGRFSDIHGRQPQILAGALIGAITIGSFSLVRSFIPMLALSILFGLSLSIVTSATSALIADLSSKETHGSAMGVLGSIMDIGHTTGPLISGIVAAGLGLGISFVGASLTLLIAAFVFMTILPWESKQGFTG